MNLSIVKYKSRKSISAYDCVLKQIMEDLNLFTEIFLLDAKLPLLQSKLRLLHQNLEKGELKRLTRGLLTFLTRWPKKKVWLRIGTIVDKYTKNKGINTLERIRILNTNRFVNSDSILEALTDKKSLLSIKI